MANPATGVAVYDSYGSGGWVVYGGTSVASPVVAAIFALTGHTTATPQFLYSNAGAFYDSRALVLLDEDALRARIKADARDAMAYYGETLDIRRPVLKPRFPEGSKASVQRVRLIYEGGSLKPKWMAVFEQAVKLAEKQFPGLEVSLQ